MAGPEVIGVATLLGAIVVAFAYSRFSGGEAAVDTDNDGDADVGFDDGEIADAETVEEDVTITPEHIEEIGATITDITGVGPTRADALRMAGYETAQDIYEATDEELEQVGGLGEYSVGQIREDIGSRHA